MSVRVCAGHEQCWLPSRQHVAQSGRQAYLMIHGGSRQRSAHKQHCEVGIKARRTNPADAKLESRRCMARQESVCDKPL